MITLADAEEIVDEEVKRLQAVGLLPSTVWEGMGLTWAAGVGWDEVWRTMLVWQMTGKLPDVRSLTSGFKVGPLPPPPVVAGVWKIL